MRHKREEWPKLVARWEASGESATAFARHVVGTNAMTLYRWRRELRNAAPELGSRLAKIIEVRLASLLGCVVVTLRQQLSFERPT